MGRVDGEGTRAQEEGRGESRERVRCEVKGDREWVE